MGTCSQSGEEGSKMLKFFIFLTGLAAVSYGGPMEAMKMIHRDINKFNSDVACWGYQNTLDYNVALYKATEQCMQFGSPHLHFTKPANPFAQLQSKPFQTLPQSVGNSAFKKLQGNSAFKRLQKVFGRSKRQAEEALIETDDADVEEFLANFEEFKGSVASRLANLTCVMTKLGMLDSNFQINQDFYNTLIWESSNLKETLAGEDPVWRQMVTDGYNDCYQIAQSLPQEHLDRDPITKVFGRHMAFFKCAKKEQARCCAAAQLDQWLELWYGKDEGNIDWAQYGFPKNKYERAIVSMMVQYDSASEEEQFIGDFINGKVEL